MATAAALRLTSHCELEWLHGQRAEATCPNCGGTGAVTQLAEISYDLFGAAGRYRLQLCPHCDVLFASALATMDYGGDALLEIGWPAYYAQVGAGIWSIADPLSRIAKPPGARALEIGGAYGFGLDFCVHARSWRGVGYDPSPLTGLGARELGLDLRQGYFTAQTLREGPWDVILATEVIEHLEDPPAFLRLMRQAIADGGILVLTTPNAAWITPDLSPDELYALLQPGAHVVLQSARSLELALKAAGFGHVMVRAEAATLTAYASPAPFRLEEEFCARRGLYRQYLCQRAMAAALGSDPQLGFAGRLIFDAVNDGDAEGAAAAWDILNEACQARFGYRLEGLAGLPVSGDDDLEGLARKMPLGLGMILYAQVMRRLAAGEARSELKPGLELARAAIAALQAALDRRSLGRDQLALSIDKVLETELFLCDAEIGRPEVIGALLARGDRREGWRGFVALVNAGAYEAAARLREELGGDPAKGELPAGLRRDVAITNFILEMSPLGIKTRLSIRRDKVLRLAFAEGQTESFIFSAFTTMVNGQDFDSARIVYKHAEPLLLKLSPPYQPIERSALFASGILFLQEKKSWIRSVSFFARLRNDLIKRMSQGETPDELFWPALRGEVLALHKLNRDDEAKLLLATYLPTYPGAPEDLKVFLKDILSNEEKGKI